MGYLGFGMRKEDYTRKPKKAYEKLKHVYGDHLGFPKSENSESPNSIDTERVEYKPYETSLLSKIIKGSLFLLGVSAVLWLIMRTETVYEFQKTRFENNRITEYYQTEYSFYDSIFHFLNKRTDRIKYVSYMSELAGFEMRLVHPGITAQTPKSDLFYANLNGIQQEPNFRNTDTLQFLNLIINRNGFKRRVYQHNWIYTISKIKHDQVPTGLYEYLETDESEFNAFFRQLMKSETRFDLAEDSVWSDFNHKKFGNYPITYTTKKFEIPDEVKGKRIYRTHIKEISKDVYWTNRERID